MATHSTPRKLAPRKKPTGKTASTAPKVATASPSSAPTKTAAKSTPKTAAKPAKPKKNKLVRDSFTIPKDEYVVIHALKARGEKLARPVKKSELLRAGIKLLAALSDAAFTKALGQVPAIKTGRPKSAK